MVCFTLANSLGRQKSAIKSSCLPRKSAMLAASQLPGKGPTDVDDAAAPAR